MTSFKRLFDQFRPRMKPKLIILGAQKAGTSALFDMLGKHPKVAMPRVKELDHFSDDKAYSKGMKSYLANFPVEPIFVSGCVTFEASPSYLYYSATCSERISAHLPETYCLAILRDPVKRAYSAWNMYRDFANSNKYAHLHDPRSFHQAIEDELGGRTIAMRHRYLLRGEYAKQIQDYIDRLAPGLLLIRSFTELKRDPQKVVSDIYGLLGLSDQFMDPETYSIRSNVRPYPEAIDPGLAKELYSYFEPEMARLNQVLGYDLNILEQNG